jgi:hypothetical protein
MKPSSAKAKGRALQNFIRDRLRALFSLPDEDVVSTPMGVSGIDVQLSERARKACPYAFEAKSYAKIAIYKWWKQAEDNATAELSPILVVKQNYGKPLVVMSWETFEDLIK